MKVFIMLFLLSLSCLSTLNAETNTPNGHFRPLSKKHVEVAMELGFEKIGKLKLNKLVKELDSVEWRTFDLGFLSGSGGKRTTSIYIVKDKMVVINMHALQNLVGKPVPLYTWALHEALGALGYDDEHYELSSSISFLATNKYEGFENLTSIDFIKENFVSLKKSKNERTYLMAGGSTVVGGGGDAVIIYLKQLLLHRYLVWVEENKPTLASNEVRAGFQKIIKMEMEFNTVQNDYNNTKFIFKNGELLIGLGGQLSPQVIYQTEYLDEILSGM